MTDTHDFENVDLPVPERTLHYPEEGVTLTIKHIPQVYVTPGMSSRLSDPSVLKAESVGMTQIVETAQYADQFDRLPAGVRAAMGARVLSCAPNPDMPDGFPYWLYVRSDKPLAHLSMNIFALDLEFPEAITYRWKDQDPRTFPHGHRGFYHYVTLRSLHETNADDDDPKCWESSHFRAFHMYGLDIKNEYWPGDLDPSYGPRRDIHGILIGACHLEDVFNHHQPDWYPDPPNVPSTEKFGVPGSKIINRTVLDNIKVRVRQPE